MRKIFYVFAIMVFLFVSCQNEQLNIGDTSIVTKDNNTILSSIPYADDNSLMSIASNKSYVPYQIARKLAIVEMELSI